MDKKKKRRYILPLMILIFSLAGIGMIFYITYQWDNKYTYSTDASVHVLSDGWEFYPDSSYSFGQEDGLLPENRKIITIGQFGNFASVNQESSPFGTAVYRKFLYLEPQSGGWLLELPEVFSACKIYVNGELIRTYGDISRDNYSIYIKNTLIPLPDGNVEIIIQASNYSHYYSGLYYPPLLGGTDAVTQLVARQLIFYAFLCFFTLGCAVVSFTVWFRRQADSLYVAYGLLCLAFAVHISYPLVHWIGVNAGVLPYVIEDTAYFVVLTCMTVLTYRLSGSVWHRRVNVACYLFAIIMTVFPVFAFYILFPVFPQFVTVYSSIIAFSKIIMSMYLITASFLGALHNPQRVWLLSGNAVFGFGILFDYLSAGWFEPVRFGWQTEYCGFIMVLLFMVLILNYNRRVISEREYLMEHLQDEVERKTIYLTSMMEERKQFLSAVAHDLKAPVAAINTYIDYIRSSGIGTDDELLHYLDVIDHKSSQIQDNVQSLQLFHTENSSREFPDVLDCNEFLRFVYEETIPYAEANGLYYRLELPEETCCIYGKKENLFRAFENLVINATEHTEVEGTIILKAVYTKEEAEITFADDGEGIPAESLEKIFDYEFSTKGKKGLSGLGLYFTRISIEEYGGSIRAESKQGEYTKFHIRLPKDYMEKIKRE